MQITNLERGLCLTRWQHGHLHVHLCIPHGHPEWTVHRLLNVQSLVERMGVPHLQNGRGGGTVEAKEPHTSVAASRSRKAGNTRGSSRSNGQGENEK
ncbi:hypothetical protein NPIL_523061 [Nephila pilipes]|uniref:Uncharacterized protein n=1 Tax=Nephila pilipes TaxID=299642 RepID=A0A8X6MSY9_NEPPI|nr:hypothetical protein NPIL_523061 [Nephila pilipes]